MPTLRVYFSEMNARRKRLEEAKDRRWSDCIASWEQTVAEFEHALISAIMRNSDQLTAVAGDLDLGPLPLGISLAYSRE